MTDCTGKKIPASFIRIRIGSPSRPVCANDLFPIWDFPADEWFFFSSVPVGDGYINMPELAKMLKELDYQGLLAVELDFTHPEYAGQEDAAVEKSVKYLQNLVAEL